jgi:hypothetical protein
MSRGKARATLELIGTCTRILEEVAPITVRGICYKLFTMGLIPDMSTSSTKRISRILTDAREDGSIDWELIVDDQRQVGIASSWSDPAAYVRAVERSYRKDYWAQQPRQLAVWSEKGTVGGVLQPVLDEYGVGFLVQKGYGSFTSVMTACAENTDLLVLYVGDYDPSGMHMSEVDLPDRIERYGGDITVERIALRRSDCAGLPGFPAADKVKDPRYRWYVESYGRTCWELDAMDPNALRERVEADIRSHIDWEAWEHAAMLERAEKASMSTVFEQWKNLLREERA